MSDRWVARIQPPPVRLICDMDLIDWLVMDSDQGPRKWEWSIWRENVFCHTLMLSGSAPDALTAKHQAEDAMKRAKMLQAPAAGTISVEWPPGSGKHPFA